VLAVPALNAVEGGDQVPEDGAGNPVVDVVFVAGPHLVDRRGEPVLVNVLFRVPDGLAALEHIVRRRRHAFGRSFPGHVVAYDADGLVEVRVGGELLGEEPFVFRPPVVKGVDDHVVQAGLVQRLAVRLYPRQVDPHLIAAAGVVDVQAVVGLGPLDPPHVIVAHVLRPEAAASDADP
jgi:hypothetical protein